MRTAKELAEATDPIILRGLGAIRRMAISLTARALWQLVGFRLPDGSNELLEAEPFTGIGIASRPPANSKPEAIVVMVGGAKSPAIIAVRDEKTRKAIAGALIEDETMLFNSQALVYMKADGTIEARSAAGVAVSLCTKADAQQIRDDVHHHEHAYIAPGSGGGPATTTGGPTVTAPVGTTKLKGE